jgi:ABC-type transport system involved in multi-copper enzyme maturation permease subunit
LLAVIFGMGSVAGEKERGSATLVLSKPLPRWAFLAAKLAAQSLLFSFGFLLGSLGGYFYTVILFGGLDPGAFVLMNLVLIAWVMPFIALTLVGSVLGNSTTAAGGISLALVIGLMLLGGIPPVSALMPTALSGWAAQLGALAAGVAASSPGSVPVPEGILPLNLGALASAFTLVTVCLAVSLGLFERQEL